MFTFVSLFADNVLQGVKKYYRKWVIHCEQHPDINHLDVGSCGEGLGDTDKAMNKKVYWVLEDKTIYLQSSQYKKHGEVDLNDHVQVFSREGCGHLADHDQHDSG